MSFRLSRAALAAALFAATGTCGAVDLLQSYDSALRSDPTLAAATEAQAAGREKSIQADTLFKPQVALAGSLTRVDDHTSTTLSLEPGVLNGTHSGFCALNLAFHMRPKRLILVGMDMEKGPNGEHHWFPPYPWAPNGATTSGKFKVWSDQFQTAFGQLRASGAKIEIWGKSAIREKP